MIDPILFGVIKDGFRLDLNGDHGIRHWSMVAEIGLDLCVHTGADINVVELFAYLHDAKREDETGDQEHGIRASILVKRLYDQGFLRVSDIQLEQLITACKYHNYPDAESEDTTIQTCWDADRLDLGRVGIQPHEKYLFTEAAKHKLKLSNVELQ